MLLLIFLEHNLVQPNELRARAHTCTVSIKSIDSAAAKKIKQKIQILLVTANRHEYNAVLTLLEPFKNSSLLKHTCHPQISVLKGSATYVFGKFGAFNAAVYRMVEQGPAAAQDVITDTAHYFGHSLNAIFAVGVACGIEGKNEYLDVLVSSKITSYQKARYGTKNKELDIRSRGPTDLPTSSFLLNIFNHPPYWPTDEKHGTVAILTKKPVLHQGIILSGNKLVDNPGFKKELLDNYAPEAIGIEMEGAGLFHNNKGHNFEILIVKAVCDFGDGKKNKKYQPTAALLAAECLKHYLSDANLPKSLKDHCRNGKLFYL